MLVVKRLVSLLLRLGISVLLLILLFKFNPIDKKALLDNIRNADKVILILALLFFSLIYILCFYRWKMLLEVANINLPLPRLIISFCGGIFFNLFLPSTIGGDLARSIDLAAQTKKPREVIATVFLDRLSGYVGLVIVVLFSLIFGWRLIQGNQAVLFSVAIITAILIAILLGLFNSFLYSRLNRLLTSSTAGKIREALKNLHQEIHFFKNYKKILLNNLILSVLIQTISPLISYLIALSLGIKINLIYFFIFLPIIGAVTLLPISIGGLGLRENTTVLFFAKAGVNHNLSLAMSLLSFFFILVYGAIGGLIYVLRVYHRRV